MKSRMPERARTDPWEPQGSNPLGPPGPELCLRRRFVGHGAFRLIRPGDGQFNREFMVFSDGSGVHRFAASAGI